MYIKDHLSPFPTHMPSVLGVEQFSDEWHTKKMKLLYGHPQLPLHQTTTSSAIENKGTQEKEKTSKTMNKRPTGKKQEH